MHTNLDFVLFVDFSKGINFQNVKTVLSLSVTNLLRSQAEPINRPKPAAPCDT